MFFCEPEKSGVIVLTNGDFPRLWQVVTDITSYLFDYAVTIPTQVAGRDENMPGGFALRQNYPNPFNPSTTIEFTLPKSAFVMLKVYNLLGKEVATLVAEQRSAGIHKFNWDASGLASGVYLYRLEAGDPSSNSGQGFVQTKKLILMR